MASVTAGDACPRRRLIVNTSSPLAIKADAFQAAASIASRASLADSSAALAAASSSANIPSAYDEKTMQSPEDHRLILVPWFKPEPADCELGSEQHGHVRYGSISDMTVPRADARRAFGGGQWREL